LIKLWSVGPQLAQSGGPEFPLSHRYRGVSRHPAKRGAIDPLATWVGAS
jgi:hypothetical protein